MHRVHHSAHGPETDSNYGATLSIWDRLFGTHRAPAPAALAAMRLGLAEFPEQPARDFLGLLALPFRGPSGTARLQPRSLRAP